MYGRLQILETQPNYFLNLNDTRASHCRHSYLRLWQFEFTATNIRLHYVLKRLVTGFLVRINEFWLCFWGSFTILNPLKPELNPICYLLALLGAHHFLHVSRIRVKLLTFRRLMSHIYGAPILDVSRSHTRTQHSR